MYENIQIIIKMETIDIIVIVLGGIVALYEALSRVVPTTKGWSILGNILNILVKVSNAFDKRK
jgi:hypothetical protein